MIWHITTFPVLVLEMISWITLLYTFQNTCNSPKLLVVLHSFVFFTFNLVDEYQELFKLNFKPYLFCEVFPDFTTFLVPLTSLKSIGFGVIK